MSFSTDLDGYEREWMELAQKIEKEGTVLLKVGDVKTAKKYRFKFYGFRKAYAEKGAGSPELAVMKETEVVVTLEGNLQFTRSPLAATLRALLHNTTVVPIITPTPSNEPHPLEPHAKSEINEHEDVLLNYLTPKKE